MKTEIVFVDRAGKNEQNFIWVAVNGQAWQIPRGQNVTVPWFVAEELRRSARAAVRRDEWICSHAQ